MLADFSHSEIELRAAGSRERRRVAVLLPENLKTLEAMVRAAAAEGANLTCVGAQRSFGDQFQPEFRSGRAESSAYALAFQRMPHTHRIVEEAAEGLWVRASAWTSFEDLMAKYPGYFPVHPPTSKRVTLAGAVAAATHSSSGHFISSVRSFSLLMADGATREASASGNALGQRLFQWVPGSYGALGVVLEVELFLRKLEPEDYFEILILKRARRDGLPGCVDRLEEIFQRREFPEGNGLYLFGAGEHVALLGDSLRSGSQRPRHQLPLTGGSLAKNIALQAISSRFPALSQRLQPLSMREGRRYWATGDSFLFFQQSYDSAYDWLGSERFAARALRRIGVQPELPVVHQTWAIPPNQMKRFLALYFDMAREFPEAFRHIELQDAVRLANSGAGPHPLGPCAKEFQTSGGGYLFTPSASVVAGEETERLVVEFFREFSRRSHEECGAIVLLLKQIHVDDALLGRMHAPFWKAVWELRRELDPGSVFTSRFLERLRRLTTNESSPPSFEGHA